MGYQAKLSDEQKDDYNYIKDYLERILQETLANSDRITKQMGRKLSRIEEDVRRLRLALVQGD